MLDRLSIRAKLTAAFAAAMMVVLALAGAVRLLARRRRAERVARREPAVARRRRRGAGRGTPAGRTSRASAWSRARRASRRCSTPTGSVVDLDAARPRRRAAHRPGGVERAAERPGAASTSARSRIAGEARILAPARRTPAGRSSSWSSAPPPRTATRPWRASAAFLIGAPLALLLASGLGYLLAGRALAPGRGDAAPGAEITLERSGERLPLPRADDEIRQLGETLNTMLDRIEASLERERGVRRRRQPRAAHAAGDPADRAGAGRAQAALARGAARGARARPARRWTGSRGSPRTCW